jgi:SAM-dependent methyltransferase
MSKYATRGTPMDATNVSKCSWDTLAELDPLWTILSDPERKFGKWDPAEFFSTGGWEAERVLAMCKSHGVSVSYGKLLDFGCGVGRMTRAFSGFFSSCVGIDVSEKMIGLARGFNSGRAACEFIATGGGVLPFADKSFDFVFTVLVLQHLPRKSMILGYIEEFIRVAKDDAVVVFQLPNEVPIRQRLQLRRRLWPLLAAVGIPQSWLFKKLGLAPILINGISRQEIEEFVCGHGGRVQAVERYDNTEGRFHSYYYFVVKQRGSSSQDSPH